MIKKTLLTLLLSSYTLVTSAHNLMLGQPLPPVNVEKYGEVVLKGKDPQFVPWSSTQLAGKVRVIQALAGRSAAKEMNAPLMAALTAAQFPPQHYQTTSIINQDDAIWGTGSFVKSSAEESKKSFPWSSIVLDASGVVAQSWALPEKSSTIIVLDKQGLVIYIKQGALNDDQINQVLTLIQTHLTSS
ncbi:YtfJ family protein [Vibrio sp.]|uniref:YtfJ family protein n=1 Tax=Vibrio sp. TaxID=678 RepID=UPI003D13547E